MKTSQKLDDHELHEKVQSNLRLIAEKIRFEDFEWEEVNDVNERMFRVKNPAQLTQHEKYHWQVFLYLANILGAVERLNDIQTYIDRFPTPRTYEKSGITQDKWIKYHYANFVSTIITIYDTSLLLVNELFLLGLDPRECNERTIARNSHVRHTRVGEILKELDNVTQEYRKPRNMQVHRGEDPKIGILQYHEMASLLQSIGAPLMDVKELDKLYTLTRSYIVEDLEFRTLQMVNVLSRFFDSLIERYILQTKTYSLENALVSILPINHQKILNG